ncbi:MAG TPA: flagellar hook-associated protein FlgK [Gemmatimonadales bacterium]|nr:flagellar hook-associated protein FlgK [Gemmatimonadales bacterium]
MSLASILNIAQSGLTTQQRLLAVISHNIANADTEGYTRQQLNLRAGAPVITPQGAIGTGVLAEAATRVRDGFLDSRYRDEAALQRQYASTRDLLDQIQSALGEPGTTGLSANLSQFYDAFSDLANDPNGPTTRFLARQAGQQLVQRFQSLAAGLSQAGQSAFEQLQARVNEANSLLAQVTQLNRQIVASRGSGGVPDLEDQRDVAIDRLSQLMGVRAVSYADGSVGVIAGNTLLADGVGHQTLAVTTAGSGWGVTLAGSTAAFNPTSGEIRALADFSQSTLPGVQAQLDQLAAQVVASVNTVHQSGTVTNSSPPTTGVPFFAPTGTTAGTIDLSAQVKASPANIVTGASGAPGDAAIALQIAQLRSATVAGLGGQSAAEFYAGVVANVGSLRLGADRAAAAQEALVANLDAQRQSVSGVNTDEEMINLIRAQQAYSAAARIVNIADEMMQELLRMV